VVEAWELGINQMGIAEDYCLQCSGVDIRLRRRGGCADPWVAQPLTLGGARGFLLVDRLVPVCECNQA
jgi:hypothetical protein